MKRDDVNHKEYKKFLNTYWNCKAYKDYFMTMAVSERQTRT